MKHIACLSLLSSSMAYAAERPNIIYIFTDQHTANAMSCAGNPDLHTPNLDRLAAAGVMFQNAYCTAAQRSFTRRHVHRTLSRLCRITD